MNDLVTVLEQQNYFSIPFRIRKSNHLYVQAKINRIKGLFLIDTGASNTCIDSNEKDFFKLLSKAHKAKASGAGSNDMHAEISTKNAIQLGKWKKTGIDLILLDLTHVNFALTQYKLPKVHGIIGSDLLKSNGAIIHYPEQLLFIK
ncbi:retroviral-like aspartic protease family protein [Flavobacterium sp. CBA20B-1]|uniref:retropepsin-like aspartic protease n=1 Tax=unclassified Flavobacterium TaxID=196869 RepID=UPI002224E33D|nr:MULTISPECIES: retropepsin-like aspartic protease [unclassified Flavobacterium]WCM41327.1 retroviral-like aspartic protease family protein [Flavobacterium sp. CBA20B-1]